MSASARTQDSSRGASQDGVTVQTNANRDPNEPKIGLNVSLTPISAWVELSPYNQDSVPAVDIVFRSSGSWSLLNPPRNETPDDAYWHLRYTGDVNTPLRAIRAPHGTLCSAAVERGPLRGLVTAVRSPEGFLLEVVVRGRTSPTPNGSSFPQDARTAYHDSHAYQPAATPLPTERSGISVRRSCNDSSHVRLEVIEASGQGYPASQDVIVYPSGHFEIFETPLDATPEEAAWHFRVEAAMGIRSLKMPAETLTEVNLFGGSEAGAREGMLSSYRGGDCFTVDFMVWR